MTMEPRRITRISLLSLSWLASLYHCHSLPDNRLLRGDRRLVVDRDALDALAREGSSPIDPTDPSFILHPPGHEADYLEDYPFFVHWPGLGCGATVVHDDIVITAAHCIRDAKDPNAIRNVRLLTKYRQGIRPEEDEGSKEGKDDLSDDDIRGITRAIAHYEVHPKYNASLPGAPSYDFLLLKLDQSVLVDKENDNAPTGVQIVKLNTDTHNPAIGDELFGVGFGSVTPDDSVPSSKVLMDVALEALPSELCSQQYEAPKMKEDIMICVGTVNGTRDTCRGDSGGPMLDASHTLVGVVSWGGKVCADKTHAGVAARIAQQEVAPWIHAQICRLSAFPPELCVETTSWDHRLPVEDSNGGIHIFGFHSKDSDNDDATDSVGHSKDGDNADDNGDGDNDGSFDIKVTVAHDFAPEETSWSFTHEDSFTLLHWQPYEHIRIPFVRSNNVFHLVAGNYTFDISDDDGISYGPGFIEITHEGTGATLWEHVGVFRNYLSVTIELNSKGQVMRTVQNNKEVWVNPVQAIISPERHTAPPPKSHSSDEGIAA